ncbi:2-phosphosulfolactate phosphatase [Nocardia miyunensis]|uniref:2-phosphosulfolactate phosphatase n=1 Tax=Nocardia miyunensis TaxID=282684 RepID=UPI000836296F|nr:2-phosphosulfolactate phosphatase [Nocardia miyunensis]
MSADWAGQAAWGVRVDWGPAGARALAPGSAVVVVVDVLSFTTSVSVAVEARTRVLPCPWHDERADRMAVEHDAERAVGRSKVSARQPWSLSPAALRRAPAPERLVLPSPNGSAISAAVTAAPVVASCLRNAAAVAAWIHAQGWGTFDQPVSVIAAGESWPGQPILRPGIEDWLGAGAVVSALARHGAGPLSPEATVARAGYDGITDLPAVIRGCASGRELAAIGFAEDVEVAVEIDSSTVVPVLRAGAFEDGAGTR